MTPPTDSEPSVALSLKDSLDLLEARTGRANGHWNFLLTLNLAVVGFLASQEHAIGTREKLATAAMLLFAQAFNFAAILRAQTEMRLYEGAVRDSLHGHGRGSQAKLRAFLSKPHYRHYLPLTIVAHVAADATVLAMLWFHR